MLEHLEQQAKACPSQKFALGGHSQGSGVAAATIPKIPKDILSRVVAVTMIGGRPCQSLNLGDRCMSYCNFNDVSFLDASDVTDSEFSNQKLVCWP
jgi:alpha-beta hydrolase superfamily lysophospholipase